MSVLATRGYGIPSQTAARGGWTVADGFGNFVFTGLRIFVLSKRPNQVFATIGDSNVIMSQRIMGEVRVTRENAITGASDVQMLPVVSSESPTSVFSTEQATKYASREGSMETGLEEADMTQESMENPTTATTVDPAELREE